MGEHRRKKQRRPIFSKEKKTTITTIIVIAAVVSIFIVDSYMRSKNSPLTSYDQSRAKGNPDAQYKIVEFVDFQCPDCARGSKIIKNYLLRYPEKLHLAVKYYSLGGMNSSISAVYAQCAAEQDKFWPFHDLLFDRQSEWKALREVKPFFEILAKDANLNIPKLETCVSRQNVRSIVMEERTLGESNFVKSTPTYFINKEIIVGAVSLEKYLKEHLGE